MEKENKCSVLIIVPLWCSGQSRLSSKEKVASSILVKGEFILKKCNYFFTIKIVKLNESKIEINVCNLII